VSAITCKRELSKFGCAFAVLWFLFATTADAQSSEQSSVTSQVPVLAVRSNVVLVPALVKTRSGEIVFSLTADDFTLTDNGVP
jgi:hypothetical protein